MSKRSFFRLASDQPARPAFVIASSTPSRRKMKNRFFRSAAHRSLIVWIGEHIKSAEDVRKTVDSFYENRTFNLSKYRQWEGHVLDEIKSKMTISLSNKDRSEIRSTLYDRTVRDLTNIEF